MTDFETVAAAEERSKLIEEIASLVSVGASPVWDGERWTVNEKEKIDG